jgi:hypothetical protein
MCLSAAAISLLANIIYEGKAALSELRIHLFKGVRADLLSLLKENNIGFVERFPPSDKILASAEVVVVVLLASAPIIKALADVLVGLLERKKSRRIYYYRQRISNARLYCG